MSDNIKVVVKVRPLISREIEEKLSYQWRIQNNTLFQLDQSGKDLGQSFTFDKVYDKDTKTSDVYNDVAKPIVQAATAGFNGTIFAYGQTSSGKTYTMTGTEDSPGIIPLAVLNLFDIIKSIPDRDFLVRVSYIEIYNETVRDLLSTDKEHIKIHESLQGIKVDAKEKVTSSPEEVLDAMKEGEANREKGSTNMNEESSRSHSIFQITIESREHIEGETEGGCVNVSQLNLVDLAGSERAGQTGATGIRFKEGTHINKSLSALALVIKQLSEDPNKFANYRDSKLTRILQNSLGGNAKTSIICAVTPAAVEETISTLQFANRAKAIKNKPEVNAVATDATMIQQLTKQMSKLQAQLESKRMLEQDNYNLQKQISALQKLILNGFGQRRSLDVIGGTKRKQLQPRRVTIHSTVSTSEDDPVLTIPKFCTPGLKYNPLTLSATAEFVPIPPPSKLASVPEEPARLVTPPLSHKTVCFSGEVIELDSDDDSVHDDHETCSPIHKCYGSSKTPPCILRKNARRAEKDLKEIVELTEREKIYAPSTVELLEKLEENTATIIMLKDKINLLNEQSIEKDKKLNVLNMKIKASEDELKAVCSSKLELEIQCDNYNAKLTDWEVSYETLKNKAKLRETELLSLLEEINVKKLKDIGQILSQTSEKEINLLDISADYISNSANENNVVNSGDSSATIDIVVTNPQEQINAKNQYIVELETNAFAYKQKIESLENITKELELSIITFKEKITNIESENSLLKSTIDSLNITINKQKEDLELAQNDRESYNSLIQELQIKIKQRDDLLKTNFDDNTLETMIANEKQFLANNENMMNFIHSFRLILASRNKEISKLNKKCAENNDLISSNKNLLDQLKNKTEELDKLNLEIDALKKQINEHIALINKLMHEQNNHKIIAEELSSIQTQYIELQKVSYDKDTCMQDLKRENDRLKINLTDRNKEIEELNNKFTNIEMTITEKDVLINTLSKYKLESEENILKAKTAVSKTQSILATLSGNMQEVPEVIDNFVHIFTVLCDSLNTLQTVASHIVIEKEEAKKVNDKLKADLNDLKSVSQIEILQQQIETLNNKQNCYQEEKQDLIHKISLLNNDLETLQKQLTMTSSSKDVLETELNKIIGLRNSDITTSETKQKEFEQTLLAKENKICHLTKVLEEINLKLKEQDFEIDAFKEQLNKVHKENTDLLTNIYRKIIDITKKKKIENLVGEESVDSATTYQKINFTLDKICNYVNLENREYNKIDEVLKATQKEIIELTNENRNLSVKMANVEKQNSELLIKVETNDKNNTKLTIDLTSSQHILQDLQTELKCNASEMVAMENKLKQWKDEFKNLDIITKKQMDDMKIENENLKGRINELNIKNESSVVTPSLNCKDDTQGKITTSSSKLSDLIPNLDVNSPPSLLTICCNRIVEFIEPKESESKTTTSLDIDIDNEKHSQLINCKCTQLTLELIAAKEENSRVLDLLAEMKVINQGLLEEQDVFRNEIKILSELTQELQKKIVNHKTGLSILTATTYTENKLLQSQVKMLQHHLKRFHNVCQKDIAELKTQLSNLMTLLKTDANIYEQQNISFKRYSLPDVLDSSTTLPNHKNESMLEGDLLMLETNITLTTAADNTLIGEDQTCMDMTQYYSEVSCQTNDLNNMQQQSNISMPEYTNFTEQIITLKEECARLRELVRSHSEVKQLRVDAQNSPIKNDKFCYTVISDENKTYQCVNCREFIIINDFKDKQIEEHQRLCEKLQIITSQKIEIEQKYNNLIVEISTDALLKKLSIFEQEYNRQKDEIAKLNIVINLKNKDLKILQEENESLSNQVMDNISEADSLIKELDSLKQQNNELAGKLKQTSNTFPSNADEICSQCKIKDEFIHEIMQTKTTTTHSKLNRSLSDSATTSRCNKICTLQSELNAGKEDCKVLTEDVVTIKNHLERSNISMDLDGSIGENNIHNAQSNKCFMPDIPEELYIDIYKMDKMDCLNYYIDKTGAQNVPHNVKIIEVMKMLYENLITKHTNEIENLNNKLLYYEDIKIQLQYSAEKHSELSKDLEEKTKRCLNVDAVLTKIKNNINIISVELIKVQETDYTNIVNIFKQSLSMMDNELNVSTVKIFEYLIDNILNKHQADLLEIVTQNSELQKQIAIVTEELNTLSNNLSSTKTLLANKEKEYNLLKVEKDKVQEITNAVTLNIVKREKELMDIFHKGYQTLIELDIVKPDKLDSNLPLSTNIIVLFELLTNFVNSHRNNVHEKDTLSLEIDNLKHRVKEKEEEINLLKSRYEKLQADHIDVKLNLVNNESKLKELQSSHDNLNKIYEEKVEENKANIVTVKQLSKEVNMLKSELIEKENVINSLEKELLHNKKDIEQVSELLRKVKGLHEENTHLRYLNDMINKEKDCYAEELKKSGETIKRNNFDLEKMTSDILLLRQSVKENSVVIENLSLEAKSLLTQNNELKEQLEIKSTECSRLETNIKTHEKTAQIQTRIITRLEKQKNDEDKILSETKQKLEDLTEKYFTLEKQSETSKLEAEQMRRNNEMLQTRVAELETTLEGYKNRLSVDVAPESSRRRRQSLQDSMRIIAEDKHDSGDHSGAEAVFAVRAKADDIFMDVDEVSSNRSTPIRLSRGRDSLSNSRTEQSDKDEEQLSRPSSVRETRRRRQTIHDSHRCDLSHTPNNQGDTESTISQLREQLASCQQELEELKEKYRELDLECETCAEYYRERDERCVQLLSENKALKLTIKKLEETRKLDSPIKTSRPTVADVSVNTDEDWTKLHSVVVDRMSFDAEVEKNKKLTKLIEELRFKKQDLKNTIAKMQKALEKYSGNRELETNKTELKACKEELAACKQELVQLKKSYKELDEECETCAQYLREREEQCHKLREAKNALEVKLHELQSDTKLLNQSMRKKRQNVHDQNRTPTMEEVEIATQTTNDLLSDQVERDVSSDRQAREVKHLKLAVERLLKQKESLEEQLRLASIQPAQPAMYVATGSAIVQNQQITDVMKENQKLKKMNAKLINICKKRGKENDGNRENEKTD